MEIEIIKSIQSISHGFWDVFFQLVTMLGEEVFIICVFAIIYWCADKRFGEYIAFSLLTSLTLNGIVKGLLRSPRPVGIDGIRNLRLETATGYSFPSGHSQSASAMTFSVSIWYKSKKMYTVAVIISGLVGLSRLYLGVHYPKDVMAGILLGFLVSMLCHRLFIKIKSRYALYFSCVIIAVPFIFLAGGADLIKSYGLLAGFAFGVPFENRFVKFNTGAPIKKRLPAVLIGLALIALIRFALKLLLPDRMLCDFIRYLIIGFFAIGVYPLVFVKMKI